MCLEGDMRHVRDVRVRQYVGCKLPYLTNILSTYFKTRVFRSFKHTMRHPP